MIKVYIASPYTIGDVAKNVATQIEVADRLMDLGYVPFVPLLAHFQHMHCHRPYQDWIDLDLAWLPCCNVLLRLPGKSLGADMEVEYARKLDIAVVYGIQELQLVFPLKAVV
jgi:hypothetical protein